jgi:hypothetical protein
MMLKYISKYNIFKRRAYIEGVWAQCAEENIWSLKG